MTAHSERSTPQTPDQCAQIGDVIYCQCGKPSSHYATMGERGAREVKNEPAPALRTSNPRALIEELVGYVTMTSDRIGFSRVLQKIEAQLARTPYRLDAEKVLGTMSMRARQRTSRENVGDVLAAMSEMLSGEPASPPYQMTASEESSFTKALARSTRRLPDETSERQCQHDLLKPDTTVVVQGPYDASCPVCKGEWHIPHASPLKAKPEPDVGALNRQLCEAEGHVFSRFAMHHCLRCEAAVTPGGYLAYTSSQKASAD